MTLTERALLKLALFKKQDGKCFYCGCKTIRRVGQTAQHPPNLFTLDHVLPRKKGGADHPDNFVGACKRCNEAKGHKLFPDKAA